DRALAIEDHLCTAWRISEKISAMYMSMLVDPDLAIARVPWSERIAADHFVVVDSNVDLFLTSIGYAGLKTYEARRRFIQALAGEIDLNRLDKRVRSYSPRLVQQAAYVFMGRSNRRESPYDCFRASPDGCRACPSALRSRCSWSP